MSTLKQLVNSATAALAQAEEAAELAERLSDVADETMELVPDVSRSHIAKLVSRVDDATFTAVREIGEARGLVMQVADIIAAAPADVSGLVEFVPDSCKQEVMNIEGDAQTGPIVGYETFYVFSREQLTALLATAYVGGKAAA